MCRHCLSCLVLLGMFAVAAPGQTGTSIPSNDEIFELLKKANEKVSGFETAVRTVKTDLDKVDPKLSVNYLHAALSVHSMIAAMTKNGPSGYDLVGLVATIDDLSLDAATATVQLFLLKSQAPGQAVNGLNFVVLLMASKNECNDISELIMHATLRYIHGEEELLKTCSKNRNSSPHRGCSLYGFRVGNFATLVGMPVKP